MFAQGAPLNQWDEEGYNDALRLSPSLHTPTWRMENHLRTAMCCSEGRRIGMGQVSNHERETKMAMGVGELMNCRLGLL